MWRHSRRRAAVSAFLRRLETNGRFRDAEVEVSPDRRLALVEALVVGDGREPGALDAVQDFVDDVPDVFAGVDAEVLVTGETAEEIDYRALSCTGCRGSS